MERWLPIFREKARMLYPSSDPSHDYLHICRVVSTAERLAKEEGADLNIVIPAAYFHDCVNVLKNDPKRKEASRLSAEAAVEYLREIGYPAQYFEAIGHAIATHSFSANIPCETIEAKVVQDADRLDGLGAIGVARCMSVSTLLQRPYYSEDDPMAEHRAPDDRLFAIDHFWVKLFKTAETMQTAGGRAEAKRRVDFMKAYLQQLKSEI